MDRIKFSQQFESDEKITSILWKSFLILAIYVAAAKFGLALATFHSSSSPIWPASGIAVAVLSMWGTNFWPAIFIGAFTANYAGFDSTLMSLNIAGGNTLEAIVSAQVIFFIWNRTSRFEELKRSQGYIAGAFIGPLFSAGIGVLSLFFANVLPFEKVTTVWSTWFVGDVLGIFLVAPLLIGQHENFQLREAKSNGYWLNVFFISVLAVSLLYFIFAKSTEAISAFLLFPMVYFINDRIGHFANKIFMIALSLCGIMASLNYSGPFQRYDLNFNLIHLQLFVGSICITSLVLADISTWGKHFGRLPSFAMISIWSIMALIFNANENAIKMANESHFEKVVDVYTEKIKSRMDVYIDSLYGGMGLFHSSNGVSRHDWKQFIESTNTLERFPGVYGLGVIWPVGINQLKQYEAHQKRSFSPFRIHSVKGDFIGSSYYEEERKPAYIITYVEPEKRNMRAIGLDIGSELNRRVAADLARDTGLPALTAKIELVQDEKKRAGFLLYLPFYRQGTDTSTVELRRKNLVGWTYAAFVTQDFITGAFSGQKSEVELVVFDGDRPLSQNIVHSSSFNIAKDHLQAELFQKIVLGQHTFLFAWKKSAHFVSSTNMNSLWIVGIGTVFSLLVVIIMSILQSINHKAEIIAEEKTLRLTMSEHEIRKLNAILEEHINNQKNMIEKIKKDSSDFKYAIGQQAIIAYTDKEGVITEVNHKFCEISQYSEEELIGKKHSVISSGLHPKEFFVDLWRTISSGKIWIGDICNRAKDGHLYWVSSVIVPILDRQNRPSQYLSVRTDITEKKLAEERYKETLIREKSALAASKLKTDFLANTSHEIRTPINGIVGLTDLLVQGDLDEQQREYALSIKSCATNLTVLINDILDLSKIEAGKIELENIPTDIDELLTDIKKSMFHMANQKGLNFVLTSHLPKNAQYDIDPTRLRQILINFISNAIKFTSKGTVELIANYRHLDDNYFEFSFSVKDTGIGMPADVLRKLFNPFTQADSSVTRKYGGTGLGLSISKRLVELMGGEIQVESKEGQGSTFTVAVPLKKSKELHSKLVDTKFYRHTNVDAKIIVAEDNAINQIVICKQLEAFGYKNIFLAKNGLEVIDLLNKGDEYDLILMDCQMPEMDGYQATQRIRSSEFKYRGIPIVAVTANTIEGDEDKTIQAGMDGYVPKPIDPNKLSAILLKFLDSTPQKKVG